MGIALVIIGAVFIIVGLRDQVELFNATLKDDLIGEPGEGGNFVYWLAAIFVIAALGTTNENVKRVTDAFLVLIFVVLFLASGQGFFDKLNRQLKE